MTSYIIKINLINNLLSWRFFVIFISFILLFILQSIIYLKDYEENLQRFNSFLSSQEYEFKNIKVYSQLELSAYRKPNILELLNKGVTENIGDKIYIHYNKSPWFQFQNWKENPLLHAFFSFDLSALFTIFFSIFGVLLLYDAISGEKDKGTLKLIFSNSVSKSNFIIGKFLSGFITLSIPLVFGFLIFLLFIAKSSMIKLEGEEWIRIVFFIFLSLSYITIFCFLSFLISSLTKEPSISLLIGFFIWVFWIVFIPNFSSYFSSEALSMVDQNTITSNINKLKKEYRMKEIEIYKKIKPPQEILKIGMVTLRSTDTFSILDASKETMSYYQRIAGSIEPLKIEYAEKEGKIRENQLNKLENQAKVYRVFSFLSPFSVFDNISSALADRDHKAFTKFLHKARFYRKQLISYIISKGGFSGLAFITRKKANELLSNTDFKKKYNENERRYYPLNLLNSPEYSPLDISDLTRFSNSSKYIESLAETLLRIKEELIYLIFLNLFFFILSYIFFIRYDLR